LYPRRSISAARTATDGLSPLAVSTFEKGSVICFKGGETGVEQFALRDYDDVKALCDVVAPENLSYQSFSSVPLDRATQLFGGGDPQPADFEPVGKDEDRRIAAVNPSSPLVNLLEIRSAADVLGGAESHITWRRRIGGERYSLLTVRRLRPFARRRFNTRRPFLVLIRTRKPCVFLR